MSPLAKDLLWFAKDQLSAVNGWHGRAYVRRCLELWEEEYGKKVADEVRQELNAAKRNG
jgi:hypothetical protein